MLSDLVYEDGKLLKGGKEVGHISNHGYRRFKINGKNYLVHRLIYKMHNPEFDILSELVVDHINRNRLDNMIENLRAVTTAENNRNHAPPLGVSFCKQTGKWKAIHPRWLGRFDTKEEALNAVNAARQE
ncbi:hypothetical protein [Escherichia phage pO91]|uniref:HNH nuclease domain-containing protein n=1 Tax=Escherichia phage pO91 TaxID=3072194 RepID=A0AA51R7V7_9CAUD|nr:hypothetical protein [Escherichia phage pO91]